MKTLRHILFAAALGLSLSMSPMLEAQNHRGNNGGGAHRTTTANNNSVTSNSPHRGNAAAAPQKGQQNVRPQNNGGNKDHGNARPGNGNVRPGSGNSNNGPGNQGNRPGNNGNRPDNNGGVRPSNPGNHNPQPPRPGHGGNFTPNPGPKPQPPHYNRPPMAFRWERPLPPPPPPYRYTGPRPNVPVINSVLGVNFGSLFNLSVNVLLSRGYNVVGTYDNMIYLNNVPQFGVIWPQVTMYYDRAGMTGARFQHGVRQPGLGVYNMVYNELYSMYGLPVNVVNNGISASATWWGGNNIGYITLTYEKGLDEYGYPLYYTDMIYGMY